MKKIIALFIGISSFAINAQENSMNPVSWSSKSIKISESIYDIVITGEIEKDWHLFSQFTNKSGSLPSVLTFENSKDNYQLIGLAKESKTTTKYNDIFEVDETFFVNNAQFTQRIRLISKELPRIHLNLSYQVCKEVCINKEENFYAFSNKEFFINRVQYGSGG